MSETTASPDNINPMTSDDFLGHPKGLYVCFFTEMWERFSFYGMKALLLLFLIEHHLFTDEIGYNLIGAYAALVYAVPVIGGMVADRYLGMSKAIIFGGCLLVLGHIGMAFEGLAATKVDGVIVRDKSAMQILYLSLALIIVGVGFLKPNISSIVGRLYEEEDPRRDSGFTLFYMGINFGAWIAPIVCGFLVVWKGSSWGFGLAGIGMVIGLLVFVFGQKYLGGHGKPPKPEELTQRKMGLTTEIWIYLGSLIGVALVWGLIQSHSYDLIFENVSPVKWFLHTISTILLFVLGWFLFKHCTKIQRDQMLALMLFILAGLVFFALYEQTYSSWVTLSERVMDRNTFGIEWTAQQLTSFGAMFIIILSPIFAWLWPRLSKRGLNPSKPMKMALGIMFASLSFLVLVWGINTPLATGLMSVWFLILAYFVLEIGEMLLSPISLSAVTQLSVKKVVGLMMGIWFLGTSYAEILAVELSKLAAIETDAGKISDIGFAMGKYEDLFIFSAQIGAVAAVIFFLLVPLTKRLMHGVE